MEKKRIDIYLVDNGFVKTRSLGSKLIKDNKVLVNGKIVNKDAFLVDDKDKIEILQSDVLKYVSRGGHKLEKGLNYFNVDVNNKVVLDIGSSTGGFSDCLLKHGAKKVYALDVGTNQLDEKLKNDERVVSLENTNFKDVNNDIFDERIDFYVCDVSFISIKTILTKLQEIDKNFSIIILYKPQFEVGKVNLNKQGVVKNTKIIEKYLIEFVNFLKIKNIGIKGFTYSPIKGNKQGNIEFLFYLINNQDNISFDIKKIIKDAYDDLKDAK